jgi:hypothetical protein
MKTPLFIFALGSLLLSATFASAEIKVTADRNNNNDANESFKFDSVPSPSKNDSGAKAQFSVISGDPDPNSGEISKLNDGQCPTEEDAPSDNFFFADGSNGGRILADLKNPTEITQVNSYSWHSGTRGAQVYKLYASDGSGADFNLQPRDGVDPVTCGWKFIAKVDTRRDGEARGGQYGVSIADTSGSIGTYRYLLFVCSETESDDPFRNTFYSEIDVVAKGDPTPVALAVNNKSFTTHSTDGKCEIVINTTAAPDLTDWAEKKLAPALAEWYPKIVAMLPSPGYTPPARFTVKVRPMEGVANTAGTRISVSAQWIRDQMDKQAVGSLVHEEVHVVQQYGRAPRGKKPGWLVEGIPDYIRFYKFEPQTHGADIHSRHLDRVKYDGSYRVSANFLNWVSEKYDPEIVRKLNAALREGKYSEAIWKTNTGKTVSELGDEWKAGLEKKLAPAAPANLQVKPS